MDTGEQTSVMRTSERSFSENQQRTTEWTGGHRDKKMCFNDAYLINYSIDHITNKPIRKIDLELSIHLFNFNHLLTEINIKINGRQGNSEFW